MKKPFWALVDKETKDIVYYIADCEREPTPTMAIFDTRSDARVNKENWQVIVKVAINYLDY